MTYVAFLRGINVGGNSLIKMSELSKILTESGFHGVRTYIQSGNIIFESESTDKTALIRKLHKAIHTNLGFDLAIALFSKKEWQSIIAKAPTWWGKNPDWKHNILILIPPYSVQQTVEAIGHLKPDIEAMLSGEGVVYQSVSFQFFGRSTTGKLAANPAYKHMTIRNYNTAQKLAVLLEINP